MAKRIIDVLEHGKRVRRPWSDEDKAGFVPETLERQATVRSVAHRHGRTPPVSAALAQSVLRKDAI